VKAGVAAQNLEEVFPDWVEEVDANGADKELIPEGEKTKAIHFPHDFNAYLIESIKALRAENLVLKEKVKEIDALKNELKMIKEMLAER